MSTDPNPSDRILGQYAESAIVVSDANGEAVFMTPQPPELKGRMMRIVAP